ncbi:MAG TPA: hypothetical protein PLK75_00525 [Bacteroidales bacterium]|nr:hypothetical protein [Bacteroidales bacterium]
MLRFDYYDYYRTLSEYEYSEGREIFEIWKQAGGSFDPANDKVMDYLNCFTPIPFRQPSFDFDQKTIDLLFKLVVASTSCTYLFDLKESKIPELVIFNTNICLGNESFKLSECTEDIIEVLIFVLLHEIALILASKYDDVMEDKIKQYKEKCMKLLLPKYTNSNNQAIQLKRGFQFNYSEFIESIERSDNADNVKLYRMWIANHGSKNIEKEKFHSYLNEFEYFPFSVPPDLISSFDWELFLKLVAGSTSISYDFVFEPSIARNETEVYPELYLYLEGESENICKKVSELEPNQVFRLFEIYCMEFIQFQYMGSLFMPNSTLYRNDFKKRIELYKQKRNEAQMIADRRSCFFE